MQDIAILHEGNAKNTGDKGLLKLLLKGLGFDVERVKFFAMGNKSNFFEDDYGVYKILLEDVESERIKKILFVIDADDVKNDAKYGGYDNTETELNETIEKLSLKNTDIYIVCDPATKIGYLESLILSTITDEQKNCICDFLNCSEFKDKDNQKAILHQIYKIAYPQSPYDFSHKNFDELKQKLTNLF